MVDTGDTTPDFTASLAHGEIEPIQFSNYVGEGPIVLAFFPAAFSNTCTTEMCTFRDDLDRFVDVGATVLGISTDLPHAQEAYRQEYDLPFGLVADTNHDAIQAYDVIDSFDHYGVETVAQRAVFVVDSNGTVTYRWLADGSGQEPPYNEVADAVADAA